MYSSKKKIDREGEEKMESSLERKEMNSKRKRLNEAESRILKHNKHRKAKGRNFYLIEMKRKRIKRKNGMTMSITSIHLHILGKIICIMIHQYSIKKMSLIQMHDHFWHN